MCPKVPEREIKMGEIEEIWQPAKFYCSEIKLIYSILPYRKPILILRTIMFPVREETANPMRGFEGLMVYSWNWYLSVMGWGQLFS